MIDLSEILQVTVGVSACGGIVILALKLLQIMTRHNVLLAGQCLMEVPCPDTERRVDYPRRFRYRLRLQNLEAAYADHKLRVKIRGISSGSRHLSKEDRVLSVVGWKPITIVHDLGSVSKDPYLWCAEFQELPGFDTWSFDVVLPCERVEFSVSFVGIPKKMWIAPTFGPYFARDRLTVFSNDRDEPRVRGPVTTPALVVPFILSILAVAMHILVVGLVGWQIVWSMLELTDAQLVLLELLLIWLGYVAIRRSVYPVISGYRFITPPWDREGTQFGRSGSAPSGPSSTQVDRSQAS
jgi:hypothetical protein